MALPDPLDIIAQKESGNRNIRNYKYGPGFTASGFWQITNPTWARWAKAAGVDLSQYPTAESAPYAVQRAVAQHGYQREGFKPWLATKDLVGQEKNYALSGSTGAAYPSTKVQPNANGIPGGVRPEDLAWGGGYTPAPQGVVSTDGRASAPTTGGRARDIHELEAILKKEFPELRVTSGYRSPAYNRKVGGASDSQHTHGTAMDIGLKELPEQTRQAIIDRAVQLGATGLGYYPNSQSAHIDMRTGTPRAWGGNKSRTSLGETPPWFQAAADRVMRGTGSTGAAYASTPGVPQANANGIPGGFRPSDLSWGGGYTPAPPGVVSTAGVAPSPADAPAPSANPVSLNLASTATAPAPGSDAARALSDPSRYGVPPDMLEKLRAAAPPVAAQSTPPDVATPPATDSSFFAKLFGGAEQPPAPKPPGVVSPTATAPPPKYVSDATGYPLPEVTGPLDPRTVVNQAPVIGEPYDPNKRPQGLLGGFF
jgi:hypothetical protein